MGAREHVDLAAWDAWRAAERFADIARQHPDLIGTNEIIQAQAAIAHLEKIITGLRKVA